MAFLVVVETNDGTLRSSLQSETDLLVSYRVLKPDVMAMLLSTCARLYRGEIVPLIIVTVRVRGQLSDCRSRCSSSCPECRGSNRPRIRRSIKSGTIRVIIRLLMTLTRGRNEFERAEQCIINVPFSQCKFRSDSLGGALG